VKKLVVFLFFAIVSVTACDSRNTRNSDYATRYVQINSLAQQGEMEKAIEYSERFKVNFPDKIPPYFVNILFKVQEYQNKKDEDRLISKSSLIKEITFTGQKGIEIYHSSSEKEKDENIGFLISYAMLLEELGAYEESVTVFETFYDLKKYLSHPQFRYAAINYANALANIGKMGNANTLYVQVFQENRNDLELVQAYIKFNADHDSEEGAASFAIYYMGQMGVTAGIKYQLCYTYEQYSNVDKAIQCYQELTSLNDVEASYLEHAQSYLKLMSRPGVRQDY
jgi:tetratricopeptide (TPR) repeat protein